MGKKKAFIDKKNAVTYNLIYRSTEDADAGPERVLVEADKGVGIGRPDVEAAAEQHAAHIASGRRYPPGHPLAWLEEEAGRRQGELSEERRRELLQLGFPDDGYDYLHHLRTIGSGAASLEGMGAAAGAAAAGAADLRNEDGFAGPSVFMPAPEVAAPEEDVRLFDASRLTVLQPVEEEGEAAGLMGGVTAFSRERAAARGAVQRELAEVEELMRQMEEEGGEGGEDGLGDLLDDFVISATEVDGACEQAGDGGAAQSAGQDEEGGSEVGSFDANGSEYESDYTAESGNGSGGEGACGGALPGGSGHRPGRPGSIASTYWREERHDRKELLAVMDERFEQLALEYDEDEIGEMEEQECDIRGPATLDHFRGIIDEFHATHSQSQRAYVNNVPYQVPGYRSAISAELEKEGLSDEDGALAVNKAHEALRRAEQAEEGKEEKREVMWVGGGAAAQERWDCESVLSLRSNLDNHPGTIRDPGRARRGAGVLGKSTASKTVAQGMIRLGRHGIPMGVLPGKPTAAALCKLDEGAAAAAAAAAEAEAGGAASGSSDEAEEGKGRDGVAGVVQKRDKGESAEEKRARKAAVKEAKREARATKKQLKEMFKEESAKAQRRAATAQVQPALRLP